jgi:hypothetical protein
MTHILASAIRRGAPARPVGRQWAAVTVRVEKGSLIVQPGIGVLKPETLVFPVPDTVLVQGPDGEVIRPSGRFMITTETFDPYHLVIDDF